MAREVIIGKYQHFKGKYYETYCKAVDFQGIEYVLYRQNYGDNKFWIRPINMFYEKVTIHSEEGNEIQVNRFELKSHKEKNPRIEKLQDVVKEGLIIYHSESLKEYCVVNINTKDGIASICENASFSGYATQYEIIRRMGYIACKINGELELYEKLVNENEKLIIDKNSRQYIKDFINPCSIDLQIADNGFLRTKHRKVDPQSIEHIANSQKLWKKIKIHQSKSGNGVYFKLKPGKTILTHTKQAIRIPEDCAGKIEIKSTFARLSLSVTSGDFCNPGYYGYFPLEITNHGNHTLYIHSSETMVQLILIPLSGPILEEYKNKATFIDREGKDEGTPMLFWKERSIKSLRKEKIEGDIDKLIEITKSTITAEHYNKPHLVKERFDDKFVEYCQKKITKARKKYGVVDCRKLLKDFAKKEAALQKTRELTTVGSIGGLVITALSGAISGVLSNGHYMTLLWILGGFIVLFIAILILPQIFIPNHLCTFDKVNIDSDILDKLE